MILAVGVVNLLFNVMRPTRGVYAVDSTDPMDEPVEPEPEPTDEGDPFGLDKVLPQGGWAEQTTR